MRYLSYLLLINFYIGTSECYCPRPALPTRRVGSRHQVSSVSTQLHAGPKTDGRRRRPRDGRSRILEITRNRSSTDRKSSSVFDGRALTAAQESNEATAVALDLQRFLDDGILKCMSDDAKDLLHGSPASAPAFVFYSLEEILGTDFSEAFHTDAGFRDALRSAMRKDVFDTTPAYANLSEKAASILLMPDSSLQGSWRKSPDLQHARMKQTTIVLQSRLGDDALSGDDMMHRIGDLCGTMPSTHWIDIVGVQDRLISHSFHQDTGMSPQDSKTVLWGFPAEDDYRGTGVFSHIVALTNECHSPESHPRMEPVLFDGNIPPECIVRPEFAKGKELLVYRDIDVLHSSPDVAYRTSVMRFM